MQGNLCLSAYCLAENSKCDSPEIQYVINELTSCAISIVPNVRQRAITYLANIHCNEAQQFFFDVVDKDYPDDIRMFALSIIGKAKTQQAREIIYRFVHWDITLRFLGPSSQVCIARGLYYFGEEEHLQIIENWQKTRSYFMDEECRNIFIELHSKQLLTPKIVSGLEQLHISDYQSQQPGREKLKSLANILGLIPNDTFARQIINFPFAYDKYFCLDSIYKLLRSYKSASIIETIKFLVFEESEHHNDVEKLVEIIVDSKYQVPKEIYYELSTHSNTNIAARAIGALKRFSYADVKNEIEKHLYGEQPQLQSWALGVLVDNGEIVDFIRNQDFPAKLDGPTAYTLLKAVRRFHLTEALPVLERIFNALNNRTLEEYTLAFDLAGTYLLLHR